MEMFSHQVNKSCIKDEMLTNEIKVEWLNVLCLHVDIVFEICRFIKSPTRKLRATLSLNLNYVRKNSGAFNL